MVHDECESKKSNHRWQRFRLRNEEGGVPTVRRDGGGYEAEQRRMHEGRFVDQVFQVVQVSETDIGIMAVIRQPDFIKISQLFILPQYQIKGTGEICMMRII